MLKAIRLSLIGTSTAVAILALGAAIAWYEPSPGPEAPAVLVSVDRTAWNWSGLNTFTYVRALRRSGLRTVIVDFGDRSPADPGALLDGVRGLVITGGGDVDPQRYRGGDPAVGRGVKPERDAFEWALLDAALARSMPILGLCRGAQMVNVFLGGSLGDFRDDSPRYDRHHRLGPGHPVVLAPESRLSGIYGTEKLDSVVAWHGQYVDAAGEGLAIVARSPAGTAEAIEAIDADSGWIVGVQWHAEFPLWNDRQQSLFDAFAGVVDGSAIPQTDGGVSAATVPPQL